MPSNPPRKRKYLPAQCLRCEDERRRERMRAINGISCVVENLGWWVRAGQVLQALGELPAREIRGLSPLVAVISAAPVILETRVL